jgi:hypothetical protein
LILKRGPNTTNLGASADKGLLLINPAELFPLSEEAMTISFSSRHLTFSKNFSVAEIPLMIPFSGTLLVLVSGRVCRLIPLLTTIRFLAHLGTIPSFPPQ